MIFPAIAYIIAISLYSVVCGQSEPPTVAGGWSEELARSIAALEGGGSHGIVFA